MLLAALARADDEGLDLSLDSYLKDAQPDRVDHGLSLMALADRDEGALGDELADKPYTRRDPPPPEAREPWVFLSLGVWIPRLRGPITVQGRSIDLVETLGLDDPAPAPTPKLTVRVWRFDITLEAFWLRYTGTKTLEVDIPIGPGFQIGETIESTVNIGFTRLSAGFQVYKSRIVTATLGLGLGLYRLTGSIEAVQLQKAVTWDTYLPVPVLTLDLYGFVEERVFWNIYIAGIGFSFDDVGAEALDVQVAAGYLITRNVALRAGYRAMWMKVRVSTDIAAQDFRATIEFSLQDGFFFDVTLIF